MGGVKLFDLNMSEVVQRGVKWFEFIPEPPSTEEITEKVYNGDISMGNTRNSRMITAKFWFSGYDALDYKLLRDEIYSFLSPSRDFYAVDEDLPGKRWKVKVDGALNITRINRRKGEVEVTFKAHRGIAESILYSVDAYTTDEDWATGMGLHADADKQDYTHSATIFGIYNAGNVRVDPRESELRITINAVNGGSGVISLKNTSTGDEWKFTGTTNAGDSFVIDRMQTKRNSVNAVGSTNLSLISLQPGDNTFLVTGLNAGFNITFSFRFLYE